MKRSFQFASVATALMVFVSLAAPARAVTAVDTTPASAQVSLTQATSISIGWRVTTNSAGSVTLVSAQGRFRTPSGALLATVASPLSRTITGPATVTFFESVLVPADILTRAQREGHDQVVYERSFTDGVTAGGQVVLRIVTGNIANFGISRALLVFDDDAVLRIVSGGATLTAKAQVAFTGNGLLQGVWEVAGPNPNSVKPEWRTLSHVLQGLTGAESTVLTSPALPTRAGGAYLVRLRIVAPAGMSEIPPLRYQIDTSRGLP